MKITVSRMVEQEIEPAGIRCMLAVFYDEDDIPNDYPHRKGEIWDISVDIETGQIQDWPQGIPARDIHMKVCDQGSYYLLDEEGKELAKIESDYVPACIPGQYGNYVNFRINERGVITNWGTACQPSYIASSFFRNSDE